MSRCFRKFVGLLSILAVLFAQLAVAAYACPIGAPDAAGELSMSSRSPAAGDVAIATSALCQKHCQNEQQNFGDQVSFVPPFAFAPSIVMTVADVRDASAKPSAFIPALLRATSPPLSISNCCFRI